MMPITASCRFWSFSEVVLLTDDVRSGGQKRKSLSNDPRPVNDPEVTNIGGHVGLLGQSGLVVVKADVSTQSAIRSRSRATA
jgi:hypothetical protein